MDCLVFLMIYGRKAFVLFGSRLWLQKTFKTGKYRDRHCSVASTDQNKISMIEGLSKL